MEKSPYELPLISVIIPCYNQGNFLADAVNSVIAQSYPSWECLILNDGSTDDTRQVAQRLLRQDSRIRYLEHENRGLAATRNRGLEEAKGHYLQFLDADDALLPTKFELQIERIVSADAPVVSYCSYWCSRSATRLLPETTEYARVRLSEANPLLDLATAWEQGLSIPSHCFLVDARIIRTWNLRFDSSLPNHEDWDFWMKVLATKPVMRFVDERLAIYRIHGTSMSRNIPLMHQGFQKAIACQRRLLANDHCMQRVLRSKALRVRLVYLWDLIYRSAPGMFDLLRRAFGRMPSSSIR
jgi:glycosyltransferase involved in cell wall biosynthesis